MSCEHHVPVNWDVRKMHSFLRKVRQKGEQSGNNADAVWLGKQMLQNNVCCNISLDISNDAYCKHNDMLCSRMSSRCKQGSKNI